MSNEKKYTHYLPTAILVDGSFFIRRLNYYSQGETAELSANKFVDVMYTYFMSHVKDEYLYRVIFYDCLPLVYKSHNPISKEFVDFSKTKFSTNRIEIQQELKRRRKVAIRNGELTTDKQWNIKPQKIKDLLNHKITIDDLKSEDVSLNIEQKGVDMRIGTDIASLTYKKLVGKIILISGDSDFVPAAKLARREGVDFVLDNMGHTIKSNLYEHIDGLTSYYKTVHSIISKRKKKNP